VNLLPRQGHEDHVAASASPSTSPVASIIIPVHERRRELNRLLTGVAQQPSADQLEVIVVDNPEPSNRSWVTRADWPFRLTHLHVDEANRGLSRNAGAAAAHGRHLVFLDSDIVLTQATIAALLRQAGERRGVIAMADVLFPPGHARTLATHILDVPAYFRRYRLHRRTGSLTFRDFVSCSFAIRTRDFARLSGFDRGFTTYGYEDVEFAYRAEQVGMHFDLTEARVHHGKHLTPTAVLERATLAGRSAVHLVALHPGIETVLPLGVAETASGAITPRHDFDLDAALRRADALERMWQEMQAGRIVGQTPRTLLDEARLCYGEIHRHGHLTGVAAALSARKDLSA
jgi:GT2 family glycosyltransferase